MQTFKKQKSNLLTIKIVFWIFTSIFFISYIMPSYQLTMEKGGNEKYWGVQCAGISLFMIFEGIKPFVGALANIIVFFILLAQVGKWGHKNKSLNTFMFIVGTISIPLGILSVLIWLTSGGWQDDGLMPTRNLQTEGFLMGYYIWLISVAGITLFFAIQKFMEGRLLDEEGGSDENAQQTYDSDLLDDVPVEE